MQEKLLFENNFVEEEKKAQLLLEDAANGVTDEPSHGSSSNVDIAQPAAKAGFAKATLSKTLPALVGYVQQLNGPTGYVFGFRSKGVSGSTNNNDGTHVTNINDPDGVETQGGISTTISVDNPLTNNTAEDFMITRKLISTNMREVKIDMTNEVEQDVLSLFGGHFQKMYYDFMSPGETNKMEKVAWFFFEYATTQMVKKTNASFVSYLEGISTNLGTVTIADYAEQDKIFASMGEIEKKLFESRGKISGRTWAIVSPKIAAYLGATIGISDNGATLFTNGKPVPNPSENSFVLTMGNTDVYMSNDYTLIGTEEKITMGIIGNANNSSIYYCPYNEYMINSGADAYTGISNIFFRVRDDWVTNPLDTFTDTQPVPTTVDDSGYSELTVIEGSNNSDYIVGCTLDFTYDLFV